MTGITQKIPNYIGGISQQPDELMPPGSVRDAVNVLPDVTNGLTKRSGSRLINPLLVSSKEGKWFHIDRSESEKYIGQIDRDGIVRMFSCQNGMPIPVFYRDLPPGVLPEIEDETGFPNCSWERVNEALFNLSEAKEVEGEKRGILDGLLAGQAAGSGGSFSTGIFYDDTITPKIGYGILVRKGYYEVRGETVKVGDTAPNNAQVSKGNRRRENVMIFKPNPHWYQGRPRTDEYIQVGKGDTYEMVVKTPIENGGTPIEPEDIAIARSELEAAEAYTEQLSEIYAAELAKCGQNYEQRVAQVDGFDTSVIPAYLKTTEDQAPLEVLTVNDYTFVTNPNVAVSMSKSDAEVRPPEAFVQITAMAYGREYTIDIKEEGSTPTSYTRATELSISSEAQFSGEDSSCPFNGNHTFTVDGSNLVRDRPGSQDAKNLVFELDVVGTSYQRKHPATKPSHYECRYRAFVTMKNGGSGWKKGDIVEVELSGRRHRIVVDKVGTINAFGNIDIHPDITPSDGDAVLSQQEVLSNIKDAIDNDPRALGYDVEIIGGGVYITNDTINFTVSTPETTLMKVITDSANDISYLPAECKDGYICKIANTDSDDDDYYVRFDTEESGVDGAGTWVETRKPGIYSTFNNTTMPYQITRNATGTFTVSPCDWEPRRVGDDKTNPLPSFCSRPKSYPKVYEYVDDDPNTSLNEQEKFNDLRFIQKMVFFRNRLTMLSGENVICSKPGDYFNFFASTALTVTDNDPIDVSASSTKPTPLLDAIETTEGLLCFGTSQQHLLSTDSEIFGPRTARFNMVGTHRYSGDPVFSLGTTVGFTQKAGLHTSVLELTNVSRDKESTTQELSKPISKLIPVGTNLITNSNDNNLLVLSKENTNDLWLYRYFQNDQNRVQSAWFKWKTLGKMIYHCVMGDVYWYVSIARSSSVGIPEEDRDIVSLQRIDLKDELATAFVDTVYADNEVTFEAHLDNYRIAQPSEFTYYNHLNQTYFRAPLAYYKDEADAGNLVAYMLSPTVYQEAAVDEETGESIYGPDKEYYFVNIGSMVPIRVEEDNLGTWFVMDGDWSSTRMMIGYQVEMKVELPTFYPLQSQSTQAGTVVRADTRSDLRIHRAKINFGNSGVYETTLLRRGREDYTEMYESTPSDYYVANEVAFLGHKTQTVPIYGKNTDIKLQIKSTHPSPATIYSVEWEGNYTRKGYRSV